MTSPLWVAIYALSEDCCPKCKKHESWVIDNETPHMVLGHCERCATKFKITLEIE